jgi:hypothetical protein
LEENVKTQLQMYREAERKLADANEAFMDMVNDPVNPLTKHDLERLIARRPEKYARFSGFLATLK